LDSYKSVQSHSTLSLYSRTLFFCFLFVISAAQLGWCATSLIVDVEGIEGRTYRNVMARLRINLYSKDSDLTENEIRRLHSLAEEDITSSLLPYGYYSSTVTSTLVKQDEIWHARYLVNPGEPVRVRSFSLTIHGEAGTVEELAEARSLFSLKEGDILEQPTYEKGKKTLLRRTRLLGFLDAAFTTHEIRIYGEQNEAEIELLLESGQRYLFGTTTSEQEIITEQLLLRFLSYQEGDYFSRQKLYELQRDLYRTDFFGSVVVESDTDNPEGLSVPVLIRVEPLENYNRYSVGVGYATDTRAYALFEWENKLLNQYGHRANMSVMYGELEKHLRVTYKVPTADPRYNSFVFTGLLERETWDDTRTKLYSFSTAYEYATPEFHYAYSLEIRDEDYRVGDTRGSSLLLMPHIQGSWALADDIVNTTNGLRASVFVTGGSDDIISDVTFIKTRADGKLILSPFDKWRLIGRGSIGGILVDSIEDIPPSLRFYAGGSNSVRGYRYKTLGPEDKSGTVIGGTFLLTGSIEAERSITDLWRAVVFYDVGNAMDDLSVDLAHGVGLGVGLALPFGQVRVELAYPLSDEGSSQYFNLTVGADL
jgi:translocation and assembly module TamA